MSVRQAVREDPLVRLLPVLRPVAGRLALGAAAGAGALACGVGLMATAAWLISRAAEHPPVMYLMVGTVAVRAFGLFRGVLRYAERLVSHDAALRALGSLRGLVLERLEPLAPGGLTAFRRGDLLARFTADVDGLQEQLLRGLTPAASALAAGLASVLVVGILLPSAGAVLVVGLLCAGIGGPVLSARLGSRGGRRAAERRRELDTAAVDLLDGAAELLANGAMDAALEHVRDLDVAVRHEGTRARTSPALPDALPLLVAGLTVWASLLLGGAAVRSGALSPTLLAVVVLTSLAAFDAVSGLPAAGSSLGRSRELARRLLELLDAPVPAAEPATGTVVVVPEGPLGLLVEAASLRYTPDGPDVLGGVSLSVPAGTRTALVGPSGAGKSSLVAALLRFHDLDAGRVALTSDGGRVATDLSTLPGDTVRSLIQGVTADAHVFDATLRENVLLGRPGAGQHELDAVAARVRLLDWIRALPQGWETQVGADGVSVSGGQRQRLLLARALLADPRVLVLDEPTAHLDLETEAAVMSDLMRATEGRTVLLVTHREAGLAACDSVVRLGDDVPAGEPALISV